MALLDGIELRGFRIDRLVIGEYRAYETAAQRVNISARVADRDTGLPAYIANSNLVFDDAPVFRGDVLERARFVRRLLLDMLAHELDECLYVNGERIFDPHKGER